MKTLLTLLLLICALSLQAQIIYDFEARMYVSYDSNARTYKRVINPCLKHGDDVSYWLININPFAHEVNMNGTMYSLTTNMPAQLAALFSIKAEAAKDLANTNDQVKKMTDVQQDIAKAAPASSLNTTLKGLVKDCNDYYKAAKKIDDALDVEEQLVRTKQDESLNTAARMQATLASRGIDATAIAALNADFNAFEAAYYKVEGQYDTAIQAAQAEGDKDKEARIVSAKEQVEKDYHTLEAKYRTTLHHIRDQFADAIDPNRYIVKSLPLKLGGGAAGDADEVSYAVKIDKAEFVHAFGVKGGLKLDFSVGPVANFISDEQYYFETGNVLQQRSPGTRLSTLTPTVASMMHLYRRTCAEWAIGGMFGVNANFKEFTDIKLGFLTGVSLILGRSQKVMVSTGVSYLPVSTLKKGQYTIGKAYPDVKLDDVTERILRPAWFTAVSLNISKRNVLKP